MVTHADLVLNNMHKFGFKVSFLSFIRPPDATIPIGDSAYDTPALLLHIAKALSIWCISILLNFRFEYYLAYSNTSMRERTALAINGLISAFNIGVPCYMVWTSRLHPGANMVYMFQSVIMWMKLVSYAHANKDLRAAYRRLKKPALERENSGYSSGDELSSMDNKKGVAVGDGKDGGKLRALAEVKDVELPFLVYPANITIKNLL